LHIEHSFAEPWQKDLFDQEICDLGVDTIDGEDYYIPSALWEQNRDAIKAYLSPFNFPFSISEVPDENWNAVWESEHPMQELPLGVKIVPHCAFGAGHHETTSMMIDALINRQIFKSSNPQIFKSSNRQIVNVLDNGCGTGVLGIFAKKLGADYVLAIDIDDKSVQNTLENAALNNVEIDARIGDLSNPSPLRGELERGFYLLLANIHRNILLAQMPTYAQVLEEGGELWMSGFYEEDCPALQQAAEENGLHLIEVRENGVWRMMRCRKEERL
jgi:ribosomal protein L11 methyltransferase